MELSSVGYLPGCENEPLQLTETRRQPTRPLDTEFPKNDPEVDALKVCANQENLSDMTVLFRRPLLDATNHQVILGNSSLSDNSGYMAFKSPKARL